MVALSLVIHYVTNVAMCDLFIRRTEDYSRLLRVFVLSLVQSGIADTLEHYFLIVPACKP